jgi:tRNA G37 N-methylase Trm5
MTAIHALKCASIHASVIQDYVDANNLKHSALGVGKSIGWFAVPIGRLLTASETAMLSSSVTVPVALITLVEMPSLSSDRFVVGTVDENLACKFGRRKVVLSQRDHVCRRLREQWSAQVTSNGDDDDGHWIEAQVPRKWEKFGTVCVVSADQWPSTALAAPRRWWCWCLNELAQAMCAVLDVRCVLVDERGVVGEFRVPDLRIVGLLGTGLYREADDGSHVVIDESATEACAAPASARSPSLCVHVENGIKYTFDARLCMFASGNGTERMYAGTVGRDEVIVDMFAGLGYFSLNYAKNAGARLVYALEKNANSFAFLKENIALNGVEARVVPLLGDNRVIGECALGRASRISMGYFTPRQPTPHKFIPRALEFLDRSRDCVVHYHYLYVMATTCVTNSSVEQACTTVMQSRVTTLPSMADAWQRYVKSRVSRRTYSTM